MFELGSLDEFINNFELKEEIGKGSYGQVYKMLHK